MPDPSPAAKIPLTVQLSADLAKRLQAVAATQKRPAETVVIDLLDRYLPRTPPGETKKGSIPYA